MSSYNYIVPILIKLNITALSLDGRANCRSVSPDSIDVFQDPRIAGFISQISQKEPEMIFAACPKSIYVDIAEKSSTIDESGITPR